jgi:hypothetical protein
MRTIEEEIKWMQSMMESLYAYFSLSKDNSYLAKYKERLGEEKFNEVYDEYKKYLEDTYIIKTDTGTDSEGITYNSLIKK